MEWKRSILYFSLMAGTGYLGLLYSSSALLGLVLLEFLVLIVSGILFRLAVRKVEPSLYLSDAVAEKQQELLVGIRMDNRSWFPAAKIQGKIILSNHFYPGKREAELFGMVSGRNQARLTVPIIMDRCGLLLLEGKELCIRDYFGLWSRKIPMKGREQAAVLPLEYEAGIRLSAETRDFLTESEEYDPRQPGDDPAEIFQIRSYREGDRLQTIHWKASARMEDLMVKDFGLPVGKGVLLFWDMTYAAEKGYGALDPFLEAGLAISQGLLRAGCEHYAIWYDREHQDLKRMVIAGEEDRYVLMNQLFRSGPCPESVDMEELYREKYRGETWNLMLRLNLKLELWKNQQLELELGENPRAVLENGELLI